MKALRHWISLCWFLLSMFSCLGKRQWVSKESDKSVWTDCPKTLKKENILCGQQRSPPNLLFLVQQLLQHIQKQSETLMAKVIHPAKNRKRQGRYHVRIHKRIEGRTVKSWLKVKKVLVWRFEDKLILNTTLEINAARLDLYDTPANGKWIEMSGSVQRFTVQCRDVFIWCILFIPGNATTQVNTAH